MEFILDAENFMDKLDYKQQDTNLLPKTEIKEYKTELNLEFGKVAFHEIELESCTVLISMYNLKFPLILKNSIKKSFVEMHFNLGGRIKVGENEQPNNSIIFDNMTHNLIGVGKNVSGFVDYTKGRFFKTFDVHLKDIFLEKWYGYNKLLDTFIDKYKTEGATVLYPNNMPVTPEMQDIISQVIGCNFKGVTRNIYLECKIQELFCLQIEQSHLNFDETKKKTVLKPNDIDKINTAKKYIDDHLEKQISIADLAKISLLNQQKLKIGFKDVFGTTVFKYAKKQKMDYAKKCLEQGQNMTDVFTKIGYANLSSFSIAFKSFYGFSPSKIAN